MDAIRASCLSVAFIFDRLVLLFGLFASLRLLSLRRGLGEPGLLLAFPFREVGQFATPCLDIDILRELSRERRSESEDCELGILKGESESVREADPRRDCQRAGTLCTEVLRETVSRTRAALQLPSSTCRRRRRACRPHISRGATLLPTSSPYRSRRAALGSQSPLPRSH